MGVYIEPKTRYFLEWHEWPKEKPKESGRYLVCGYEECVPDHADEEPYSIDVRMWIGYYSKIYGWDANPKIIAWMKLPDLPDCAEEIMNESN